MEKLSMNIIKKTLMVAALSMGLAFTAGSSFAAELSNGIGTRCIGIGDWHFVNPQTGLDAPQGTITVDLGSCGTVSASSDQVNNRMQHFRLTGIAGDCTLLGASTDLDGKLVLSDYDCDDKKEPPPEPPK
jgi:hypothetical protein